MSNLNVKIAHRELYTIHKHMDIQEEHLHIKEVSPSLSPGNLVIINILHSATTECIVSFGEQGLHAKDVAKKACEQARQYLNSEACVGVHLADQLLIPLAIAGDGKFTTLEPSSHTRTNIGVIKQFLPCEIELTKKQEHCWQLQIINAQNSTKTDEP